MILTFTAGYWKEEHAVYTWSSFERQIPQEREGHIFEAYQCSGNSPDAAYQRVLRLFPRAKLFATRPGFAILIRASDKSMGPIAKKIFGELNVIFPGQFGRELEYTRKTFGGY